MNTTWGPGMISSEDARLVAHIAFAPSGMAGDLETVEAVNAAIAKRSGGRDVCTLPTGYALLAGRLVPKPDRGQSPPDGHHPDRNPRRLADYLSQLPQSPTDADHFLADTHCGFRRNDRPRDFWHGDEHCDLDWAYRADWHRRRRRRRNCHLHGTVVRPPSAADGTGHSRGHGGGRTATHSPLP